MRVVSVECSVHLPDVFDPWDLRDDLESVGTATLVWPLATDGHLWHEGPQQLGGKVIPMVRHLKKIHGAKLVCWTGECVLAIAGELAEVKKLKRPKRQKLTHAPAVLAHVWLS